MKRNLLTVIGIFLSVITLMLLSDIVTLGEKLAEVTHWQWSEYIFYLLLLFAFFWFIIRPIIQLHNAPTLPALTSDGLKNSDELRKFGLQLAKHCDYIPEGSGNGMSRIMHRQDLVNALNTTHDEEGLKRIVNQEIALRLEGDAELGDEARLGVPGINNEIKQWASTVFMVTAVSPNSKIDTVSVMVLNYQMIRSLVAATGFRPGNKQLFSLYWNILATALFSYVVSESLSDVGDIKPFEGMIGEDAANNVADSTTDGATDSMADGAAEGATDTVASDAGFSWSNILGRFKIPGFIAGPVMDGVFNALLTLRIGYVTRAYLLGGVATYRGASARQARIMMKRAAIVESFKAIPPIVTKGCANIGQGVGNTISALFTSNEWRKYQSSVR